jgi:hypothetical protein
MACKNVGLFRNRRDLGSQPVLSHWLYQRTKANQHETGEDILGWDFSGTSADVGTLGREVIGVCLGQRT